MVISFRPAVPADLPAIASLVNSAYRGDSSRAGWTTEADLLGGQRTDPDSLRDQLATGAAVLLLAQAEGTLYGCVFLERDRERDEAYLGMLTIAPALQNTGLGRALLAHAETFAREAWQANAMRMTVIAQRTELLAWYERRGYVPTGEREPFPYGDARFGLPKRADLYFSVLRKALGPT